MYVETGSVVSPTKSKGSSFNISCNYVITSLICNCNLKIINVTLNSGLHDFRAILCVPSTFKKTRYLNVSLVPCCFGQPNYCRYGLLNVLTSFITVCGSIEVYCTKFRGRVVNTRFIQEVPDSNLGLETGYPD
jgi:hypothetical protein